MEFFLCFCYTYYVHIKDFSDSVFTSKHERFVHTMRAIQGSVIVSSFFNIVIGYSKIWGNYTRFFSPVVIIPVVCVVGLGWFERGFPKVADCIELGLPMLVLLVICQQYLKRLHESSHLLFERFGLLFCTAIGSVWADVLTVGDAYNGVREQMKQSCRTDHSHLISTVPWIKITYPFQWGAPIFKGEPCLWNDRSNASSEPISQLHGFQVLHLLQHMFLVEGLGFKVLACCLMGYLGLLLVLLRLLKMLAF